MPFASKNINRNNRRMHFRTAFTIFIKNAFWNGLKLASCVRFVNKMLSNEIIYFRINIKIIFFLRQWKPSSEKLYRSNSTYFCQIRWNYIFQVVPNNTLFQPLIKKNELHVKTLWKIILELISGTFWLLTYATWQTQPLPKWHQKVHPWVSLRLFPTDFWSRHYAYQ